MTEGPSTERVCVHCGTSRSTDVATCPECGKPWVDEPVSAMTTPPPPPPPPPADDPSEPEDTEAEAASVVGAATAGAATGAAAAGLDDTGEFGFDDWTLPPERPSSKAKWIIPIILLIAAAVVWAMVFLDDGSSTTTTVAAPTTTQATTTTTEPATTTTVAETTTTEATTTTTTVPYPPPSSWAPVGDPIPTDELTLKAEAIGPLDFGTSIEEIAGRLTASLGEAESATDQDLCPPAESYALQWGELLAIFDGYDADSVFVSYRYEDVGSDTQLGLMTLSGLALGDTVADLKRIYSQFTIAFETIDGVDHFRLSDGGELLLWGPVTDTSDDGIVIGIYSPTPCDG